LGKKETGGRKGVAGEVETKRGCGARCVDEKSDPRKPWGWGKGKNGNSECTPRGVKTTAAKNLEPSGQAEGGRAGVETGGGKKKKRKGEKKGDD